MLQFCLYISCKKTELRSLNSVDSLAAKNGTTKLQIYSFTSCEKTDQPSFICSFTTAEKPNNQGSILFIH